MERIHRNSFENNLGGQNKMKHLRQYIRKIITESIETKRVFDSPEPYETFRNVTQESSPFPKKPDGLWYSCGNAWREFVRDEMFGGGGDEFSYEIDINSSAMLMISSLDELDAFHDKYIRPGKFEKVIDWSAVQADGYAGIEICPYQRKRRMTYFWYYSWDVASGCIWNDAAILDIREINTSLSEKKERDYKAEYARWGKSKKARDNNNARKRNRYWFEKEGKVKPGDGKEIDHKVPLCKGGSNERSNLRVVSKETNRKKAGK